MSNPVVAEDQLLELLLTLKRTTPQEARTILNSQPQIAYALMAVMAEVGAVKMEVVQETLAKYGALPGVSAPVAPAATVPPAAVPQQPPSAIPPHMQSQVALRGEIPTYTVPPAYPPQPPAGYPGPAYGTPPPTGPAPVSGYGPSPHTQPPPPHALPPAQMRPPHMQGPPPPAAAPPTGPRLPDAFAGLPEEQKALILRVMQMSREEIYALPPTERDSIITLRNTVGMPV